MLDQMAAPLDVAALAAEVASPAQAAEVYAASLLAIDADTDAERSYLADLAARAPASTPDDGGAAPPDDRRAPPDAAKRPAPGAGRRSPAPALFADDRSDLRLLARRCRSSPSRSRSAPSCDSVRLSTTSASTPSVARSSAAESCSCATPSRPVAVASPPMISSTRAFFTSSGSSPRHHVLDLRRAATASACSTPVGVDPERGEVGADRAPAAGRRRAGRSPWPRSPRISSIRCLLDLVGVGRREHVRDLAPPARWSASRPAAPGCRAWRGPPAVASSKPWAKAGAASKRQRPARRPTRRGNRCVSRRFLSPVSGGRHSRRPTRSERPRRGAGSARRLPAAPGAHMPRR